MSSSPPIARAVAVLNFLAGHPGQAFTLTEITKSLRISSATGHSLLGALVDAGYIYRTAAKAYVLGPAIGRLGQERLTLAGLLNVVRPEMRALADAFDVVCSASFLDGEDVIVRERAAAVSHIAWNKVGAPPQKAIAPVGNVFMAGSSRAQIEAWVDRADPPITGNAREEIMKSMDFLRDRGFTFGERIVPLEGPERALELRNRPELTSYTAHTLKPGTSYNLAFVAAPVFAEAGRVAFSLNLLGFNHAQTGKAVEDMGSNLRAACDRIGAFIDGRPIVEHHLTLPG